MRWDYSAELGVVGSSETSPVEVRGLVIYKTLYDDNNTELARVETTPEDAHANSEEGFLEEYRAAALALFVPQLEALFSERDVYQASLPSLGILLGNKLRDALKDIVVISGGTDV